MNDGWTRIKRRISFIIRQNAIENILTLLFAELIIWARDYKPSTRDDMVNKS